MVLDSEKRAEESNAEKEEEVEDADDSTQQGNMSHGHDNEDEDEDDKFVPGKQVSLQEQLQLDKDDESLQRWKEQLLGSVSVGESSGKSEVEVEFRAMRLLVEGREPLDLPFRAFAATAAGSSGQKPEMLFVLRERSRYRLQFEFCVRNELVLGLTYVNRVYRLGAQVDKGKVMLGTYGPQNEPYQYLTEEETTPHGILARGKYSAKTEFIDDDGKTHLAFDYAFEIKKEWQ